MLNGDVAGKGLMGPLGAGYNHQPTAGRQRPQSYISKKMDSASKDHHRRALQRLHTRAWPGRRIGNLVL